MTHRATGIHAGIPAHGLPDQLFRGGTALDQFVVLSLRDAARMLTVDVHDFATGAVELLDEVRLAAASA